MSKDIRSFFLPKKVQKVKVEDDDDDVIPESPDVQIKNKKKEARKKRVLCDSDEEIFESKKKKVAVEPPKSKNKNKSPQKNLKEVKIVDMFGNSKIKRTEPLVKKEKKNTETGIHSDDEFEKSLLELDAIEELANKSNGEKESSEKLMSPENKKEEKEIEKDSPINEKASSDKPKSSDNKKEENKIKKESRIKSSDSFKPKEKIKPEKDNSKTKSHNSQSKADNENKRKFAEFIDAKEQSDKVKDEKINKKTKINDSFTKEKSEIHKKVNIDTDFNDSDVINGSMNESVHGKSKLKKTNKSLNESVLTDEERHERKSYSAALYQKYLNRSGPKHLGAKEIPEGSPDCLKDFAFLLTGVLDSFEREEIAETIVKYGGCIKNGISKKVTHVLAGEDAGPAKMAKAQELGVIILNEDEFLQIIRDSVNKKPRDAKEDIKKEKASEKPKNDNKVAKDKSLNELVEKSSKTPNVEQTNKSKHNKSSNERKEKVKSTSKIMNGIKVEENGIQELKSNTSVKPDNIENGIKSESCGSIESVTPSIMWVDKYKPQNVKQIIGQHGDASNVKKLSNWLTKWYINRRAKLPKPSPWAKNDDGGYYKAALLSGPPGVGKTTTVSLVCKELGFDVVEFNASDTRSKTLIKEQITELLTTTSLSGFARGQTGKQAVTKKHVLVMDEVDGMAGNEDRGGLQELIGLIKVSSVPIICMCNDRNSQKMRSLVNYCYDLRFNRPRVDQIKSAMMSICFKEGVKVPPDVLSQLIVAANQDVRQTLHLLSVWAADPAHADADRLRNDAKRTIKDVKLGPWEAVRKVFSKEDHKGMSLQDRSDLFFYDYSLAPLFVQENYLQVMPHCPKKEILDRVSQAADCISLGDLVDARIRGRQAWNLLPVQAMYSSVMVGQAMRGHVAGQIQFPGWLGKNSRANKMHRLCQEIHAHTRLSTSGSKSSIFLDYCTHLRNAIIDPLIKDRGDGIPKSMEVLESYHLLREDLDSLTELALWPGQRNPMVLIDSKVKAAMTRAYNKSATALPYAPGNVKKVRAKDEGDLDEEEDLEEQEVDSDSDPENDALIKKKKTEKPSTSKEKAGSNKEKATTSKEKAGSGKEKKKKK